MIASRPLIAKSTSPPASAWKVSAPPLVATYCFTGTPSRSKKPWRIATYGPMKQTQDAREFDRPRPGAGLLLGLLAALIAQRRPTRRQAERQRGHGDRDRRGPSGAALRGRRRSPPAGAPRDRAHLFPPPRDVTCGPAGSRPPAAAPARRRSRADVAGSKADSAGGVPPPPPPRGQGGRRAPNRQNQFFNPKTLSGYGPGGARPQP